VSRTHGEGPFWMIDSSRKHVPPISAFLVNIDVTWVMDHSQMAEFLAGYARRFCVPPSTRGPVPVGGKQKSSLKFNLNPYTLPTILLASQGPHPFAPLTECGRLVIAPFLWSYVHMSCMGYWNSKSQRTRQRYKRTLASPYICQ
jgi:hypothetical protein